MWTLSCCISVLLCSQLLAAASTGSSRYDLPRIRVRDPQFGAGFRPKGFPGLPKEEPKGEPKGVTPAKSFAIEDLPKDTNAANPLGQLAEALGGVLGALGAPTTTPAAVAPVTAVPKPTVGPVPYLEVLTTEETVQCRQYPDIVSPDLTKVTVYTIASHIVVQCWAQASGTGPNGRVQGSYIWLRTVGGCYISEMNVQNTTDFQVKLAACPVVQHSVGTLQTQYKRQDCYDCTNTNCTSKNLGAAPQVEVSCSTTGEMTGGSSTWWKSASSNCFFPAAIFQPKGWFGTPAGKCP